MASNNSLSPVSGNANVYFNTYKTSLFAEVEKHKTTNKLPFGSTEKIILHRLVYVATINQRPSQDRHSAVIEYYEQFVSNLKKTSQTGITGRLLVYPKCVIHLLESSSEVLTLILKDLRDMEEGFESCLLKDSRILVVSHCLQGRIFPSWGHRFLNIPLRLKYAFPQNQPVELLVSDTLAAIYKLCASLLKCKVHCERLDAQEQTSLLEEENIVHLCHSQVLHSPTTFLQTYTKPVNIVMESEIVWPTHHRLCWSRE